MLLRYQSFQQEIQGSVWNLTKGIYRAIRENLISGPFFAIGMGRREPPILREPDNHSSEDFIVFFRSSLRIFQ